MKGAIFVIFVTFHFVAASLRSFTWTNKHLVPGWLMPPSRIPQFIHDARHPWLEEHRIYLELLDDPKKALCDLQSSLRPSNAPQDIRYPHSFFRSLDINNNRHDIDRSGWKNAVSRLYEILDCPAALHDVECFNVQISIDYDGWGWTESARPPKRLPDLFIRALTSMPHVRKLEWNTFGNGNEVFKKAFSSANISLPSVRHLTPAEFTDYLVNLCPGVEYIEGGKSIHYATYWRRHGDRDARPDLIESTKLAENLTAFAMTGEWELKHLNELLVTSPNISTLKIKGEIAGRGYHYYFEDTRGQLLREYAKTLTKFPNLRNLTLPGSADLALGFDGGPGCGNAYFGSEGRAYARYVSQQSAETTELAAEIVLQELPDLRSLQIGSYRANLTRGDSGDINVTWPWTGRMKEWTYCMWPDRKDYSDEL